MIIRGSLIQKMSILRRLLLVLAPVIAFSGQQLEASDGTQLYVEVSTFEAFVGAINSALPGTTVALQPGRYVLSSTIAVRVGNVRIVGMGEHPSDLKLIGPGMEVAEFGGAPYGVWADAEGLVVKNLTIEQFYRHGIILNPGAEAPHIDNVHFRDIGQQFIKANPTAFGDGVDNGVVENSVFAYSEGPPTGDHGGGTGYTNAIDVHAGAGWVIRNNRFSNFHTPDSADHLWNPAVLMWNGARDTIVEGNYFENVDRAVAFGLVDREHDHFGGVIRDNTVVYSPGLYSLGRRFRSDGAIIVWSSPETNVIDNTVLTRNNLRRSIEFRFDTEGARAIGNRVDAPIGHRDGAVYTEADTVMVE